MICQACGANNPKENQFCAQCGAKLASDLESTVTFMVPKDVAEDEFIDLDSLVAETPLLVIVKGRTIDQTFPLKAEEISVGRDPASDIFLDDITVSRRHAKILFDGNNCIIQDRGSLNGTYLNRQRIEKAKLNHKDELQIGKFKMIFIAKEKAK
jgi:pSer/pThr/pTyr-binding forkhead associated (FHA) protein